ncbi:BTAD domain-containing putative transcriptional regulator [Streptomyces sp. NPDC058284]|uniref:BTAD domain-containing putative transcriptional regulator n=1 Tax=unclassified Streptomyces TaxID=2593676 RepID=UPI00365C13DE
MQGDADDAADTGGALWFQVLGPVRAWRDGRALTLGPPQQRATLAALLLRDGHPVSAAELVDALWGEEPPMRAVGTLRTYVSRLRALLEPDRRSREPARLLVSAGDGYALRLPPGSLDACELEARVAAARTMRTAGEHADAYAELTAALALSDGAPLAGLPGPYAQRQRDRLTELSVTAQEEFFTCALELGCHGETTAPLSVFAAEHPLRERAQALLMLALHRGGRRADALAVYETTRRTLAAELGVDPGRELTALYEGLLKGTPLPEAAEVRPGPLPSPYAPSPQAPPRVGEQRRRIPGGRGRGHGPTEGETADAPEREGGATRVGRAGPDGGLSAAPPASEEHAAPTAPSPQPRQAPATPLFPCSSEGQGSQGSPPASQGSRISPGSPVSAGSPGSQLFPVSPLFPASPLPSRPDADRTVRHLPRPRPRPLPVGTERVGSAVEGRVPAPAPLTPAQLLPDVPDFTGREAEARLLAETLRAAASGSAMAVATLTGLGGVGKTALAVHVAHALRGEFPDGQLYVDLRGADPAPGVDSGTALTGFLRALGVPESGVPDGLDQQTALYRSLLAGRRVLVLLDNARDTAQVRPLLPGTPGCAVLVTSRSRTITLPGARLVDVETMDEAQGLGLLRAMTGAERVAAEPAAARELVAICGGLPLAVRIAAARLAARPGRSVADLAARLRDEHRRLDELRVDDLGVEASFRLGYEALEPGLARAFRMVSLCYMPSFCRGAAGALLDVSDEEAECAVERLVDAGLMELHGEDRYRFHDLVRLFARRQCEREESARERAAARLRFLDYVLATVITAIRRTKPHSVLPQLLHVPASAGKALPDEAAAQDWLVVAHSRLLAAAENALRHVSGGLDEAAGYAPGHASDDVPGYAPDGVRGDVPGGASGGPAGGPPGLRPTVDLLTAWSHLVAGTARHRDLEPLAELALRTARAHGDERSAARALRLLGAPHFGTETFGRAERALRESLRLAASAGDPLVGAEGSHELGIVLIGVGRHEEALEQLRLAYARFGALGGHGDRIRILSHMARAYISLGRRAEADTAVVAAERQARQSGSASTLAHVLYQAGCTLLRDGRAAGAAERLREAQRLHGRARNPRWEALCWARLAYCELEQGRPVEAMKCADAALALEGELGDAFCHALAMAARGRALLALGDLDRGRGALRIAHRVMERRGALEAVEIAGLLERGRAWAPDAVGLVRG